MPIFYVKMARRRAKLRELGICINGRMPPEYLTRPRNSRAQVDHGEPVSAGKCARCIEVHARSR